MIVGHLLQSIPKITSINTGGVKKCGLKKYTQLLLNTHYLTEKVSTGPKFMNSKKPPVA